MTARTSATEPAPEGGRERREGIPPEVADGARVLILGSFPGEESLRRRAYYAHPENLFWPFMEELLGVPCSWPYRRRLAALKRMGVGLWDVVRSCRRRGSLDQKISRRDLEVNDFAALYRKYPGIRAVLFNGSTAHELYRRLVLPRLAPRYRRILLVRLPSTSPANRYLDRERKLGEWKRLSELVGGAPGGAGGGGRKMMNGRGGGSVV